MSGSQLGASKNHAPLLLTTKRTLSPVTTGTPSTLAWTPVVMSEAPIVFGPQIVSPFLVIFTTTPSPPPASFLGLLLM